MVGVQAVSSFGGNSIPQWIRFSRFFCYPCPLIAHNAELINSDKTSSGRWMAMEGLSKCSEILFTGNWNHFNYTNNVTTSIASTRNLYGPVAICMYTLNSPRLTPFHRPSVLYVLPTYNPSRISTSCQCYVLLYSSSFHYYSKYVFNFNFKSTLF